MESINQVVAGDFKIRVRHCLDHSISSDVEAMVLETLETISDETGLYDAMLSLDGKMKTMQIKMPKDTMHPVVFKRMEQIMN